MPGGWIDDDETPSEAIQREVEEETGWRARAMKELGSWFNMPGISDARCTLYRADGATLIGGPQDDSGSTHVGWVPVHDIPRLISDRQITDGDTLIALSLALAAR